MEMNTRWTSLILAGGLVALTAAAAWAQLPATIDLNVSPESEASPLTRVYGDDWGDNLGTGIAFGDVNGDGFDDVIFGAYEADPPGGDQAGEVVVVYGSASLPASAEVDLNSTPGTHGETRILGDDENDWAGSSVASGDVNGDGFDDVILGVSDADPPGGSNAGEVVVVYGRASFPASAEIDLNTTPGAHGESRILRADGPDRVGWSVAGGAVNGDGFDDVILGVDPVNPLGVVLTGEVVVIYGSALLSGIAEIDLNSLNGDVRVLADRPGDSFGADVEIGGDVDRDGFADFAASAYNGDNPSIGGDNESGVGYLIYGDGTAPSATVSQGTRTGDGASPEVVPATDFGPVARCVIDFSNDDTAGNSSAEASMTTVTLTRSDAGLNLSPLSLVADVQWEITTDRVGWASAEVTFQYTDAEAAGPLESSLVIQQAATAAGPFTALPTTIDPLRNEATATVSSFSVFALVGETVPTGLNLLGTD